MSIDKLKRLEFEWREPNPAVYDPDNCRGMCANALLNVIREMEAVNPSPSPAPGAQAFPKAEAQGVVDVEAAAREIQSGMAKYDAEGGLALSEIMDIIRKHIRALVPPDSIPVAEVEELAEKWISWNDGVCWSNSFGEELLALVARHRKVEKS